MALNRSPQSVSPQNEFYFSITIVPTYEPGMGPVLTPGYHMNRIDIGPNIIVKAK